MDSCNVKDLDINKFIAEAKESGFAFRMDYKCDTVEEHENYSLYYNKENNTFKFERCNTIGQGNKVQYDNLDETGVASLIIFRELV